MGNNNMSWSTNKKENDKFLKRNKDNKKKLDLFIKNNDVKSVVCSNPLFFWLRFYETDDEFKGSHETRFKYKNTTVLLDDFYPSTVFGFILRNNNIKFDVPCVCGIYSDEKHL